MTSLDKSTLWANRKCLLICSAVAMASMQYGIDTAAVGGLQVMPGFLKVFGYQDPTSPLGYGIDASVLKEKCSRKVNQALMSYTVNSSAAHDKSYEPRSMRLHHRSWILWRVSWSQIRFAVSMCCWLCCHYVANWINDPSRSVCWSLFPWLLEWILRGIFDGVLQRGGTFTSSRVSKQHFTGSCPRR
jgi:hypothetical protein